jgi:hypothetical protein
MKLSILADPRLGLVCGVSRRSELEHALRNSDSVGRSRGAYAPP